MSIQELIERLQVIMKESGPDATVIFESYDYTGDINNIELFYDAATGEPDVLLIGE